MTLEMVSPGDPFPLTDHRKYNEIARAANAVNNSGGDPSTNKTGTDNGGLIRVYNGTTVPGPEFSIMAVKEGLSKALVDTGALSPECAFAQGLVYELEAVDPAREQTLCILQEPIGAENFGQAKLFGVSQLKVEILDQSHRFAKLKESQPTPGAGNPQPAQLESATTGGFEIVSRPDGQTGEQWCTVRFPVAQGGGGSIQLVQVVGVNASAHTVQTKSILLKADVSETPNFTVNASEAAKTYPYLVQ